MKFTAFQEKVLNWAGLAKVTYRDMWNKDHELGYCTPANPLYNINIAKDFPDEDVKDIILLHEVGHIYFNHISVDVKKEIIYVKGLFEKLGKPYSLIKKYGGPMSFLNICMDLEVNSKLLTISNVNRINQYVKICTPNAYEVNFYNDFRDYYEPLISKLEEGGDGEGSDSNNGNSSDKNNDSNKPDTNDIYDSVGALDSDFDEEISKELMDEQYKSGESKATSTDKDDVVETSTVEEIVDKAINNRSRHSEHSSSTSVGKSHSSFGDYEVKRNSSEEIIKFIKKIIKKSDMEYQPDSLRHYNRNTRNNRNGIMYTSLRRKHVEKEKKIMFICDVSGSMDIDSITKAISSLKDTIKFVSRDAKLVTWDTNLCQEFAIDKLPKTFVSGGGTDMAKAVKYATDNGYKDIILYTDLGTDITALTAEAVKADNFYTIGVGVNPENYRVYTYGDTDFGAYLKANKDVLWVEE